MKGSVIKQCILLLLYLLWTGQALPAGELQKRVYLQADKQFHLSGELIWVKFIITDLDQQLPNVNEVGYMELLDSTSAAVQARPMLEKGVDDGRLQLPSTLSTGNYRPIAYTRYIRNRGEEIFSERPLVIVNTSMTNEILLIDTLLPVYSFARREGPVSVPPDHMIYDIHSRRGIRISDLSPDLQTLSVPITRIDLYKPFARSGIADWE